MGEIFPQNIKAHAASLATGICFLLSYLTSQFFSTLIHTFGIDYTFWLHGGFCFTSVIYVYYIVPETKGLSLQEIQQLISQPTRGYKSPWTSTANENDDGLSMPTITADGKIPSNETVFCKLNGVYTLQKCTCVCHI